MSRFIESICLRDGNYQLLELHQQRVNGTFQRFFKDSKPLNLQNILPKLDFEEKYKIRVVYGADSCDVEFSEYVPRKITSLQLVESPLIDYRFKFEDRRELQQLFERRNTCDDIIITQHGKITDTFYSNLAFWEGNQWITPRTCLLNGVKRMHYLNTGLLQEVDMTINKLKNYERVSLINAMLDIGECMIDVSMIKS